MVDDHSGALLIRVWLEAPGAFRARLMSPRGATDQTPADEVTVAVASSPGGVLDAVREWLEDFIGNPADSSPSGAAPGRAAAPPAARDGESPAQGCRSRG